jgi:hypothetical protein
MMELLYRIVNYETGEVAELSALPENRSYALKWYYKRACSWARDNVRCGLIGIDDERKIRHRKRGVHLYAIKDGIPAYRIELT